MSLIKQQIKMYFRLWATIGVQYQDHHIPSAKILSFDDHYLLIEYSLKGNKYICSTKIDQIVGIILLEDEHKGIKKIDDSKQYE